MKTDLDLPAETFSNVENLMNWMKSFEFILLSTFWFKTLQCIDDVNKLLQYADISFVDEVRHIANLRKEIQTIRDSLDSILDEAKNVALNLGQTVEFKKKRVRTRKQLPDDAGGSSKYILEEENAFKIGVFYAALDKCCCN